MQYTEQALRTTPITTTIEAPDWPAVIHELLEPFSTGEVWNKQQPRRVFLLERDQAAHLSKESARFSVSDSQRLEELATPESPPTASLPPLPPLPPPIMDDAVSTFKRRLK